MSLIVLERIVGKGGKINQRGIRGGRLDRDWRNSVSSPLLHKSLTTNNQKKKTNKQTSKQQVELRQEVERNYKMLANPVFINPGTGIFLFSSCVLLVLEFLLSWRIYLTL